MKKILLILILCLIKLNAYQYQLFEDITESGNSNRYFYYTDTGGRLWIKRVTQNGSTYIYNDYYYPLRNIKVGNHSKWITPYKFRDYFTNDLKLLNDLFTQMTNPFMNYLYNENVFSSSEYINYENYELLYNSDGLAVESIVNGKWAGLFDGPDSSGYLYNEKGDLLYINGVPTTFFERLNNRLLKKFKINLQSIFIKKIFYPLLILIFACVVFRTVIRMAFKAFLIRFYDKKIRQLENRREKIENA